MLSDIKSFNFKNIKRNIVSTDFIINFDLFFKIKVILFFMSLYLIFMGIFSTQIGILNPAIVLIWIGWWLLLTFIFLPINAKNWCAICPIPLGSQIFYRYAPMKWFISRKFNKKISLFGIMPILLFLIFSAISVPLSTIPLFTGIVLALLIIFSTGFDIYFNERSFCKHICPINPLLLTYNRNSLLELKTKNFSICASEHEKTCMFGDETSFGCDWGYFPGKLKINQNNCTNCLECIKSCTYDNLEIKSKQSSFLPSKDDKINWIQSFSPLFFLGVILTYSITKIGSIKPFHSIILIDDLNDLILALIFESFFTLILIPFLFLILVILPIYYFTISKNLGMKIIKTSSYVSIPISLALWIIFSIYLIVPNIDLIFIWMADPFLLNWNILNLKSVTIYSGQIKEILNVLSQLIFILGYLTSLYYSYNLVNEKSWKMKEKYFLTIGQFVFYSVIFGSMSLIYFA